MTIIEIVAAYDMCNALWNISGIAQGEYPKYDLIIKGAGFYLNQSKTSQNKTDTDMAIYGDAMFKGFHLYVNYDVDDGEVKAKLLYPYDYNETALATQRNSSKVTVCFLSIVMPMTNSNYLPKRSIWILYTITKHVILPPQRSLEMEVLSSKLVTSPW